MEEKRANCRQRTWSAEDFSRRRAESFLFFFSISVSSSSLLQTVLFLNCCLSSAVISTSPSHNPSIPNSVIYPPIPVTAMGSSNHRVRWASKRPPPNHNATNSANPASSDAIGQNRRQTGVRPPSQGQHPDHTLQHQNQNQQQQQQQQKLGVGQVSDFGKYSSPSTEFRAPQSLQTSPGRRPYNKRTGAARGTRSATADQEIASAFEWEALKLEKDPKPPVPLFSAEKGKKSRRPASDIMSRNRPRGPPLPRDNGQAANEETDMWNKIMQDLRKAKGKNDKQKSLAELIASLNEKIGKEGSRMFLFFGSFIHPFSFDLSTLLHDLVDGLLTIDSRTCPQ